ncbi:MAG: helix-turn-helix transcriptional regulator [Dehalococcoidales bacterium]|jgi:DNA-binding CsgD family transcriptional regulator|nr:helix-turn-helix transcriptional regulator [Dehalococcoidales bacterium]
MAILTIEGGGKNMGIRLIEGNAEDKGYILENNIHVTFRELQVLFLLARGQEQSEIAKQFGISINTVRNHIYNVMIKLNAKNRSQAIVKALENGIFEIVKSKYLVKKSASEYGWCWKCNKVFLIKDWVTIQLEPIEINHVMVNPSPYPACPYCKEEFDISCLWSYLLDYNPELPKVPNKNKTYKNLDYVRSYFKESDLSVEEDYQQEVESV